MNALFDNVLLVIAMRIAALSRFWPDTRRHAALTDGHGWLRGALAELSR